MAYFRWAGRITISACVRGGRWRAWPAIFLRHFRWRMNGTTCRECRMSLLVRSGEYDRRMVAFEKTYCGTALINGAIPICHEGCALRVYLVVTGAQAGFLWEDRRAEYAGIRPVRLADGAAATFGGWYEEWLSDCLAAKG